MSDHSPPPGMRGQDLETWASLATILEWLPPALDAQMLRDAEMTHFEYGILFALADAPDLTLRMSVLAGYANSSLSRLSRAVLRLEKRGWVERRPDPTDGRYTLATMTEPGRHCFDQATPGHADVVQRLVLDPLSEKQKHQLREISQRILRAIREEEGWRPPGAG